MSLCYIEVSLGNTAHQQFKLNQLDIFKYDVVKYILETFFCHKGAFKIIRLSSRDSFSGT